MPYFEIITEHEAKKSPNTSESIIFLRFRICGARFELPKSYIPIALSMSIACIDILLNFISPAICSAMGIASSTA